MKFQREIDTRRPDARRLRCRHRRWPRPRKARQRHRHRPRWSAPHRPPRRWCAHPAPVVRRRDRRPHPWFAHRRPPRPASPATTSVAVKPAATDGQAGATTRVKPATTTAAKPAATAQPRPPSAAAKPATTTARSKPAATAAIKPATTRATTATYRDDDFDAPGPGHSNRIQSELPADGAVRADRARSRAWPASRPANSSRSVRQTQTIEPNRLSPGMPNFP